jgi:arsenical pump membrane protein
VVYEVTAGLIASAVLVCVIWRPRGMPVAIPATVGALLVVVLNLVGPPTLLTILTETWDASATLIALFLLSEALDSNGFFTWAALHLARIARGSGWRLYVLMLALTTATTALLANDGAILILTPVFVQLLMNTYEKKEWWFPYIFAAGFFADATSALFIPSNLTNIMIADANALNFTIFVRWMILPTLFAIIAAGFCFGMRFRTSLGIGYDPAPLKTPVQALQDRHLTFWGSWIALLALIVGYSIGGQLHLPISFIAGPIALAMVLLVHFRSIRPAHRILRAAPWSILLYALGMFVVMTAAFSTGAISFLTMPLHALITSDPGVSMTSVSMMGTMFTGGMLALLSAGTNNLPATLVAVLVLHTVEKPVLPAIYAIVLGVDIGPKLTPYGSLATLLWLGILSRHGVRISWRQYVRENWWIALVALVMALCGLLVTCWLW